MRVVMIGFRGADDVDCDVVDALTMELVSRGRVDLSAELIESTLPGNGFDMTTAPGRGDAIDAIVPGVELVVALNLFGVSQIPGGRTFEDPLLYVGRNGLLLDRCMRIDALFACFGREQPWFSLVPFKRAELAFGGSHLFLYERAA